MLSVDKKQAQWWLDQRALLTGISEADRALRHKMLLELSDQSRLEILRIIASAGLGHVGGDFSVIDILTTLYFSVLNVDPQNPDKKDRDWLILSKGHCAAAIYVTLARAGYFPQSELTSFMKPLSYLNGHPSRGKVPGVETSTGPLGHGLPVGVGGAIAAKLQKNLRKVFVIVGDGELQEGSNWEAAMLASHYKLNNLTVIVDRNGLQQGDSTENTNQLEPLDEKWTSFGWEVIHVDGHNPTSLLEAINKERNDRPRVLIAKTTKGKGVSFMENKAEWHHKVPNSDQIKSAIKELTS